MNLILVSGRYEAPGARDSDREFARILHAAGCRVRWIVPVDPREAAAKDAALALEGVDVIPVPVRAPGFTAVQSRLIDTVSEKALGIAIRRELPDLVHVLDYGGATTSNPCWVADRMGVPSIVSVRFARTVCHRGDLVYGDGSPCDEWQDSERCAACCRIPSPATVGRIRLGISRILQAVRFPFDVCPTPLDFRHRRELVVAGLTRARRIAVCSEAERDALRPLGLRSGQFVMMPGWMAAEWLSLYRELCETGAAQLK